MSVVGALLYGIANLLHPRMLWLMVWPMLVALVFWGAVAVAFWGRLAAALAALFQRWLEPAAGFVRFDFGDATVVAAYVVLFLLIVPLVYLTALFILGVFGMQKMVDYVAQRSFPALERKRGGSLGGSVWNGTATLGGIALAFTVSLPLWLLPPLWPLIPLAIFTWANQRLLRYDALAEHADREEMMRLFRERRGALLLLGLALALLAYVPLVGFIAPVAVGLAVIRYCLGALQEMRAARQTVARQAVD
jgi:CysZ protein